MIASGQIVPSDSILNKLPWIDQKYVYKPLLTAQPATGTDIPAAPAGAKVEVHNGFKWDMSTNPPTNLGAAN